MGEQLPADEHPEVVNVLRRILAEPIEKYGPLPPSMENEVVDQYKALSGFLYDLTMGDMLRSMTLCQVFVGMAEDLVKTHDAVNEALGGEDDE